VAAAVILLIALLVAAFAYLVGDVQLLALSGIACLAGVGFAMLSLRS
jgi:hypothetical protein